MRRFGFKGFSLVEVMVSLGILGVASLGVMKLTTQSTKTQKRLELNQNALDLMNRINLLMLDSRSCAATLAGVITHNRQLPAVRGQYSVAAPITDVFLRNQSYFNNSIAIQDIRVDLNNDAGVLVPLANDPSAAVDRKYGQVRLRVTFRKTSSTNSETNAVDYTKFSPWVSVTTFKDAPNTDNFIECHSSEFSAVQTARERVCNDLRGTINAASGRCELRTHAARNNNITADNDNNANMMGVSRQFGDDAFINNDADETLNGDLIIDGGGTLNPDPRPAPFPQNYALRLQNGSLLVANGDQVCIGGRCRNFNPAACAPGTVITAINPDNGEPVCSPQLTCPTNNYFHGLNTVTGQPDCRPIPHNDCLANQYVKEILANGTVVCAQLPTQVQGTCGYRQFLAGYNSFSHTRVCKQLFQDVPYSRRNCSGNDNFIRRINQDGTVQCNGISGGTIGVYSRPNFHGTGVTLLSTSRPRWNASCSRCGGRCTPSCGAGARAVSGRRCSRGGNCGWNRWRNCDITCETTAGPTYRLRRR